MAKVLYTADLHFGHTNVIRYCARPFADVDEMDEALVANWNECVRDQDTVYILGDVTLQKHAEKYLQRLRGHKILVVGNHDYFIKRQDAAAYFDQVAPYMEIQRQQHKVTLCHYPLLEWDGSREDPDNPGCGYLVHGHIHNAIHPEYRVLFEHPLALNAGVDVNGYCPVTWEQMVDNNRRFARHALAVLDGVNEAV